MRKTLPSNDGRCLGALTVQQVDISECYQLSIIN